MWRTLKHERRAYTLDPSDPDLTLVEERAGRMLLEHPEGGWSRFYVVDVNGHAFGPFRRGVARRLARTGRR